MHSFGGSIEVAQRLIKHGAWFSFSGYFLQERKAKVLEVFKHLPQDRILLETDAPDMMPPSDLVKFPLSEGVNHPANLGAIAEAFEKKWAKERLSRSLRTVNVFGVGKENKPYHDFSVTSDASPSVE